MPDPVNPFDPEVLARYFAQVDGRPVKPPPVNLRHIEEQEEILRKVEVLKEQKQGWKQTPKAPPPPLPVKKEVPEMDWRYGALALILKDVEEHDRAQDYAKRAHSIYMALGFASGIGLTCGIQHDPDEPDWPLVFIDLPTGQVSWHMQEYIDEWDGHSTPEKYERIRKYREAYKP